MHTYMRAVGITYAVELAVFGFMMILALLTAIFRPLQGCVGGSSLALLILAQVAISMSAIVWIVWGIVVLSAISTLNGTSHARR
jgi:hypothetical protein